MMSSGIRPRTTKPRGVCKYYTTARGCFAGSRCRFLHGDPEQLDSCDSQPLLSPYDESKRCIYYAKGFCRHGDHCWFKHIVDDPPIPPNNARNQDEDQQDEPCSICFETPVTYGLLSGCSHIFCITCIRQWRDQKGQIEHGTIKRCPMCRESSKFITPSSRFWKHGHPEKERVTDAYKQSMARVPCRYFQRSRQKDKAQPLCPFGKDCFYQHLGDDGAPFIFENGVDVCMRQYYSAMRPATRLTFDDFMDLTTDFLPLTVNVLQEAMDSLESAVSASNDTVARTLDIFRLLVQRNTHDDAEPEHSDEINRVSTEQSQNRSASLQEHRNPQPSFPFNDLAGDSDALSDMPGLPSISDSSSGDAYASDSESDSDDAISQLGRYLRDTATERPGTTVEHSAEEDEDTQIMQDVVERNPGAVRNYDGPTVEDEIEQRDGGRVADPPFLTDGRGRVVWSGHGEASELMDTETRPPGESVGELIGLPGRNKITR